MPRQDLTKQLTLFGDTRAEEKLVKKKYEAIDQGIGLPIYPSQDKTVERLLTLRDRYESLRGTDDGDD